MPYILLDRWFSGLAANFVGVNDEIVGAIATEHLIEIGCRQHSPHLRNQREHGAGRLKGYTHTLARHGIPVKPEYIVSADRLDTSASLAGYQAAIKLIAVSPCPTGIFCCNDPVAIGAMTAILDAGLRIPEDVALIGCGNLQFDSSLRVPLSSVDQRSKMIWPARSSFGAALGGGRRPPSAESDFAGTGVGDSKFHP